MRISDWSSDVCSSDLAGVPPDCSIADCQGRIRNPGTRLLERRGMNEAAMDMQQLFIADIGGGAGDPLEPGIRSQAVERSEEHTSELQSLMRNSYAVFCLKKKTLNITEARHNQT